jgi:hypothetical protein
MTLADASKRYGPLSICKPPILAAATASPTVPAATSTTPRAAPAGSSGPGPFYESHQP